MVGGGGDRTPLTAGGQRRIARLPRRLLRPSPATKIRIHAQHLEGDPVRIAESAAVKGPLARRRVQAVIHVHCPKADCASFGQPGQQVQQHHRIRSSAVRDTDSAGAERCEPGFESSDESLFPRVAHHVPASLRSATLREGIQAIRCGDGTPRRRASSARGTLQAKTRLSMPVRCRMLVAISSMDTVLESRKSILSRTRRDSTPRTSFRHWAREA